MLNVHSLCRVRGIPPSPIRTTPCWRRALNLTIQIVVLVGLMTPATAQTLELDAARRWEPRSLSLGDATSGEAHSIRSILANPAALGLVDRNVAVAVSSAYDSDLNRLTQRVISPLLLDTRHSFAVSGGLHQEGDRSLALNREGVLRAYPDVRHVDLDAFYSLTFPGDVSLGVGLFTSYVDGNGDVADPFWSRYVSLGLLYRPDPSISYGIVFQGLGNRPVMRLPENTPPSEASETPEPSSVLLQSVVNSLDTVPALVASTVKDRIQIASTFRYPYEFAPTRFTLSLASEKVFTVSGLTFKGGLELYAASWLVLRTGFLIQTRQETDGARFGAGLRARGVHLDYGIVASSRRDEYVHQLSLLLPLRRGGR